MTSMNKICLISGASGVAKSSTAKKLSEKYGFIHRLGSGFIREMAKAFLTEIEAPSLYRYSFYQDVNQKAFQNLYDQSLLLQPMIELAIMRAFREGTGLIIEGVNIIPGLTKILNTEVTYIVLYVKDKEKHFKMINGDTHGKRVVSQEQFKLVRSIQNELIQRASQYNWPILDVTQKGDLNEFDTYLF